MNHAAMMRIIGPVATVWHPAQPRQVGHINVTSSHRKILSEVHEVAGRKVCNLCAKYTR